MSLRPLSNIFAVRSVDEEQRTRIVQAMTRDNRFTATFRLDGDWVVGVDLLPGSSLDPPRALSSGIFFAEGRDEVEDWSKNRGQDPYESVVDIAQQKPADLQRVPGDFAFLILSSGGATIVRSAAGLVPWYVRVTPELTAISTRIVYFHRLLHGLSFDPLVCVSLTDGTVCPDRRTAISGVRSVPSGHVAHLDLDGKEHLVRYWSPVAAALPRPSAESAQLHAQELRELLITGLRRELDPAGRNLIGLSGGVDSSSLAALAAGPAERPLNTFSLLPPQNHPRLPFIEGFVDSIEEWVKPASSQRVYLTDEQALNSYRNAPTVGTPVPHRALTHLRQLIRERDVWVLTGGEFADDLFAGLPVIWYDWLNSFGPASLAWALRKRGRLPSRRRAAPWWLRQRWCNARGRPEPPFRTELPELAYQSLRDEYRDWVRDQQRILKALPAPYRYLEMDRQTDGWVAQNWEACSELRLRRSLPFFRRSVIELAYRCHPLEHAMPPKNLLRLGLSADVPAKNLFRKDKGAWPEAEWTEWTEPLPARLAPFVRPDWLTAVPRTITSDDASTLLCLIAATERPPSWL